MDVDGDFLEEEDAPTKTKKRPRRADEEEDEDENAPKQKKKKTTPKQEGIKKAKNIGRLKKMLIELSDKHKKKEATSTKRKAETQKLKKAPAKKAKKLEPVKYVGLAGERTAEDISIGSDCAGYLSEAIAVEKMGLQSRCKHKFASDKDKAVQAVLFANYDIEKIYGDISKRRLDDVERVDVYVNTSPCTDFSVAGFEAGLSVGLGRPVVMFLSLLFLPVFSLTTKHVFDYNKRL